MKKLSFNKKMVFITAMMMTISFSLAVAAAAEFNPQAGLYYRYDTPSVTFHTYTTPIPQAASASVIIETPNALVLQDVQLAAPNNMELKALINSLKKPLKRIIISHDHDHHWIGLELFEGVPVYANAATIQSIKEKGADMLANAKEQFGEEMVPYKKVVVPENMIKPGMEVIDGIRFVYSTPMMELTGPVNFIELPDQKVLIHHHLAYNGVHVPLPPIGPRLDALKQLKGIGYDYLIGGHGIPSDPDAYFDAAMGYYTRLGESVKSSPDPKMAKEKMIQAYPNWGGVFLLDMMLPAYYKK